MKPVNEMSDEEVIEELLGYKSSVDIDLSIETEISEARRHLNLLRLTFSVEDDNKEGDI